MNNYKLTKQESSVITKTGWRLFYKEGYYKYCKRPIESGDETIYKLPCDICLVNSTCKTRNNNLRLICDVIGEEIIPLPFYAFIINKTIIS